MTVKEFVKLTYPEAEKFDISPVFTIAQAGLESGWGEHAPGNNYFGVTKGSKWTGKTQLLRTTECFYTDNKKFIPPECVISIKPSPDGKYYIYTVRRLFKVYDSISDCFKDHFELFKKPCYSDAWQYRHDPVEFTKHIQDSIKGKYATSVKYVDKMINAIDMVKRSL